MKRILTIALALALLPAANAAASTVFVSFDKLTQTVVVGDTFTLDIIADISSPVLGWGLDMNTTGSSISLSGLPAIGPQWGAGSSPDGDGLAGMAFPSSISGNSILLARLTYHADAIGLTDLCASFTPGDDCEGFALDPTGFADIQFTPASVNVIPEPSTVILLAAGLLLGLRRRMC